MNSLLNEIEAAAFLSLPVATLRKWRCCGGGPTFAKIGAKLVRYSQDDLTAFVEAGRRTSTSDLGPGSMEG